MNETLRIDKVQGRVRCLKNDYTINTKVEQQYNSVTKRIHDVGWIEQIDVDANFEVLWWFCCYVYSQGAG